MKREVVITDAGEHILWDASVFLLKVWNNSKRLHEKCSHAGVYFR